MTISTSKTIWCDREDCYVWVQLEEVGDRAARRKATNDLGWGRRRSAHGTYVDLCPLHDQGHRENCHAWQQGDCNCGLSVASGTKAEGA